MVQGRDNGLAPNSFANTKSASRTDSGSESHVQVGMLFSASPNKEGVEVETRTPRDPIMRIGCMYWTVHPGISNIKPPSIEFIITHL